jgi:hypothetical protein
MTSAEFSALPTETRVALADYRAAHEAAASAPSNRRSSLKRKAKKIHAALVSPDVHGLSAEQVESYMAGADTEQHSPVTSGTTGDEVKISHSEPAPEPTITPEVDANTAPLIDVKDVNPYALEILQDESLNEEQKLAALDQVEVTGEELEIADAYLAQLMAAAVALQVETPVVETRPAYEFVQVGQFVGWLAEQIRAEGGTVDEVTEDRIARVGSGKVDSGLVKGYGPNTKRQFPNPTFVTDTKRLMRKLANTDAAIAEMEKATTPAETTENVEVSA